MQILYRYGQIDGPIDGQMDRQTNGWMEYKQLKMTIFQQILQFLQKHNGPTHRRTNYQRTNQRIAASENGSFQFPILPDSTYLRKVLALNEQCDDLAEN